MVVAVGSTGPAVRRSEPMLSSSDLVAMVGVSDLDRARAFYGDVLGLPVTEESRSPWSSTPAARCCG